MSMIPEGLTAICDYDEKEGAIIFACRADMRSLKECFSRDALTQITQRYFSDNRGGRSDVVLELNIRAAGTSGTPARKQATPDDVLDKPDRAPHTI